MSQCNDDLDKMQAISSESRYQARQTLRMALVETFHLAHLPPSLAVHIALFRNLRNAVYLRQQLLDGNRDFEYALIDANVILSITHLLAAVFRAANDYQNGRIKSRNVHSEIVFALSPNNNIAESFRKFGIADTTTNLLVVQLSTSTNINHESVKNHLDAAFEGESVELCDQNLASITDLIRLRKAYKLSLPARSGGNKKQSESQEIEDESSVGELEMALLGLIALKGAT